MKGDSYVRRTSAPASSQPRTVQEARRDLQHACKSSDAGAVRDWAARWAGNACPAARPEITPGDPAGRSTAKRNGMEHRWRTFSKLNERDAQCTLADAQFFVAREHGFASWPKFATHLEALAQPEFAGRHVRSGRGRDRRGRCRDARRSCCRITPSCARARSTREHRSTLLHYVSANGVEDFRQKTPKNIVEITEHAAAGRRGRQRRRPTRTAADRRPWAWRRRAASAAAPACRSRCSTRFWRAERRSNRAQKKTTAPRSPAAWRMDSPRRPATSRAAAPS